MKKKNVLRVICCLSILVGCQEILFVEDISAEQVAVLAPTELAVVQTGNVTFSWQPVYEAESYQIQIATPTFTNATQIVLDSTLHATSFSKEIVTGSYQWRVKALNSAYQTNYTTVSFSATDTNLSQSTLELVLPEDNIITNIPNQTFTWNAIVGASEYRFQIWKPDSNGTKEEDITTSNTSTSYNFTDGSYTWQVRAQNSSENSSFSTRNILIDTTLPNTPVLESPADDSTTSNTSIGFKWNRSDIVGSVEADSIYVYTDAALTTLNFKEKGTAKAFTKTMSAGIYYWVVKGFDEAGNKSTQSNTFTFTIN
jgi:hypothetical protein